MADRPNKKKTDFIKPSADDAASPIKRKKSDKDSSSPKEDGSDKEKRPRMTKFTGSEPANPRRAERMAKLKERDAQRPYGRTREQGDRPSYGRPDRPSGNHREQGDRPSIGRPDRPSGKPREQQGDRPSYGRPDRPSGKPREQREQRSFDRSERPAGKSREQGERPSYGRPDRPSTFRPSSGQAPRKGFSSNKYEGRNQDERGGFKRSGEDTPPRSYAPKPYGSQSERGGSKRYGEDSAARPFQKKDGAGKRVGKSRSSDNANSRPDFRKPARPSAPTGQGFVRKSLGKGQKGRDNNTEHTPVQKESPDTWPMRLNKYLAHAGIAARRKAADMVKEGLINVNGVQVLEPYHLVNETDKVTYKDKVVAPVKEMVYILMNKPKDVVTTIEDDKGRRTVLDIIGDRIKTRIYPVGRLDKNTTGLLVLTNDGSLADKMTHPSYEVKKLYHATLDKPLAPEHLEAISKGITLEDGPAPVRGIHYVEGQGMNQVGIEIHIGRNRIVRRIFEHLGYDVQKLDRVYLGGLTKKDLPRGHWRYLTAQEVIMLKHFV